MTKKHFIAFANWIAAHTKAGTPGEASAIRMVLNVAADFNERFDGGRFVAWIEKQRLADKRLRQYEQSNA